MNVTLELANWIRETGRRMDAVEFALSQVQAAPAVEEFEDSRPLGGQYVYDPVWRWRVQQVGKAKVAIYAGEHTRNGIRLKHEPEMPSEVPEYMRYREFDVDFSAGTTQYAYVGIGGEDQSNVQKALNPSDVRVLIDATDPWGLDFPLNASIGNVYRCIAIITGTEDDGIKSITPLSCGDIDDTVEIPDGVASSIDATGSPRRTIGKRSDGAANHKDVWELWDVGTVVDDDLCFSLYDEAAKELIWLSPDTDKPSSAYQSIEAVKESGTIQINGFDSGTPAVTMMVYDGVTPANSSLFHVRQKTSDGAQEAYMDMAGLSNSLQDYWADEEDDRWPWERYCDGCGGDDWPEDFDGSHGSLTGLNVDDHDELYWLMGGGADRNFGTAIGSTAEGGSPGGQVIDLNGKSLTNGAATSCVEWVNRKLYGGQWEVRDSETGEENNIVLLAGAYGVYVEPAASTATGYAALFGPLGYMGEFFDETGHFVYLCDPKENFTFHAKRGKAFECKMGAAYGLDMLIGDINVNADGAYYHDDVPGISESKTVVEAITVDGSGAVTAIQTATVVTSGGIITSWETDA